MKKVAMHFNDLLMKLRTQSLGGVAAIATLAGIVAKSELPSEFRWGVLMSAFFLLNMFWIAIWVLDFRYYNRLLVGAVDALIEVEAACKESDFIDSLNLSTRIEQVVSKGRGTRKPPPGTGAGRWMFYGIVFVALFGGLAVSVVGFFSR